MRRLLIPIAVWGAALALAAPSHVAAQNGRAALAGHPHALFMRIHMDGARAYAAPRTNAAVVAVYARNEQVMAVEKLGPYYKVVRPGGGAVGYVLGTELVPLGGPGADVYPGALRPPARARFDLYGGVALPMTAGVFAEAYGPGLDVGVRMNYRFAGPLGLAARLSYSRFGPDEGALHAEALVDALETDRDAFSLLSGALGLDLKLLAAGPVAFRILLDGGIYHAVVSEAAGVVDVEAVDVDYEAASSAPQGGAPADEAFAEEAFTEWGGSAAFRLSVRLGSGAHFFLEPGYEVILTESERTQYAPLRLGLSLGR